MVAVVVVVGSGMGAAQEKRQIWRHILGRRVQTLPASAVILRVVRKPNEPLKGDHYKTRDSILKFRLYDTGVMKLNPPS